MRKVFLGRRPVDCDGDPSKKDTSDMLEEGSYRCDDERVRKYNRPADPYALNYRTQSALTVPTSNLGDNLNRPSLVEKDDEQELADYAELAVSKIVADNMSRRSHPMEKKMSSPIQSATMDDYPMDEPPRITPVPVLNDLLLGTHKKSQNEHTGDPPATSPVPVVDSELRIKLKKYEDEYYCDPPQTLIIRSFQGRSMPFESEELSDISPILDSIDRETATNQTDKEEFESMTSDTEEVSDSCLVEVEEMSDGCDPEEGYNQATARKVPLNTAESENISITTSGKTSHTIHSVIVGLLFMFVCCATGYLVVYFVDFVKSRRGTAGSSRSAHFVGDKPTTPMDPYDPSCIFTNQAQPNVIGQCKCDGKVSILPNDVREKYSSLQAHFTSMNVSDFLALPEESCDPRNQALVWLATTYAEDQQDLVQKYLLASFFIYMAGETWLNQEGWLLDIDICRWSGVACDSTGLVKHMLLGGNGLRGSIPDILAHLAGLESISLKNNAITGELPSALFTLPEIKALSLSHNMLSGTIPSGVEEASKLEVLELDMNSLEGSLPMGLFTLTSLQHLNLEQNRRITGRLDAALGNWARMESLSLSHTNVQSRIPTEVGFLTNLRLLKMADSQLSGIIPSEMALLTKLNHLDLSGSKFRRSIPKGLGNLPALEYLRLNSNRLTGRIPDEIGNLSTLFQLTLHGNMLFGEIPRSLGALTLLDTLTLQNNALTGRAPSEVCELRQEELIVFTTDCSDGSEGVLCPVPNCCTECLTNGFPA